MALTADSNVDLEKIFAEGMSKICEEIKASRKRDCEPILVTVSRRMPHVLFWYKNSMASKEQVMILDTVEVITEIALPFIDFHPKRGKIEILIIDDVIASGRTVQYIIGLCQDFSGIPDPKVFVFFYDAESFFTYPEELFSCVYEFEGKDEKAAISNYIASIIAATLPIDVTYPLIYLDSQDLELRQLSKWFIDIKSEPEDNYHTDVKYKADVRITKDKLINKGTINRSYTCLLPSELTNSLNNDFAKVRLYDRMGEYIIVPYAPNILSDSELRDPDLFLCSEYREIWNTALNTVNERNFIPYDFFDEDAEAKENVSNRSYRSLVCIANYLYSLSSFNRIVSNNKRIEELSYHINQNDLCLIAGKELSSIILPLIREILNQRLISPRVHRKLNVTATLIPEIHQHEYDLSKYMCLAEENIEDDLNAIFINARNSKYDFPGLMIEDMEYDVEGIMESFQSLEEALLAKTHKKKVEINHWVDERIDEGVIVSRYAHAFDDNGTRYWRRYFRLSTSLES